MQEEIGETETRGIMPDIACDRFSEEGWESRRVNVPAETELTIYINSKELVTILCTPTKLNCLVLGFLYTEGIISGMSDVASMRICDEDLTADVMLKNADFELPRLRTLTSGCGGGVAFATEGQKIDSALVVTPEYVLSLMKQLQERMELYRLSGGIHTSALGDSGKLVVVAEDIGRHNTLDKIMGECLLRKISAREGILMTTGRVSSEMLLKATKIQVPVVASRTSPTGRAISLALELGITLIGYARGGHLSVYSHPERLGRKSVTKGRRKP